MTKKNHLILLTVGLCIASGLLVAMSSKEEAPTQVVAEEEKTIKVVDVEAEALDKVVYQNNDEQITFVPQIEEVTDTIQWQIQELEGSRVDEGVISSEIARITLIEASRQLEEVDLEAYGINETSATITYYFKEGESQKLQVGDLSTDGTSRYIVDENNPTSVSIVPSYEVEGAKKPLSAYRITTLDVIDKNTLVHTKVTYQGETLELYPDEVQRLGGEYKLSVNGGESIACQIDPVQELLSAIPPFEIIQFVEDEVEDLKPYGLEEPKTSVTFTRQTTAGEKEVVTYHFGEVVNEKEIYFRQEGIQEVYTMDRYAVENWLQMLDAFKLREKMMMLVPIDSVDTVEISVGDKKHTLSLKRESEEVVSYISDTKHVAEEAFKQAYAAIISIRLDTELQKEVAEEEVARITFQLSDGQQQTYSFYAYDTQFYAYQLEDGRYAGCNKGQFDYMLEQLKSLSESATAE